MPHYLKYIIPFYTDMSKWQQRNYRYLRFGEILCLTFQKDQSSIVCRLLKCVTSNYESWQRTLVECWAVTSGLNAKYDVFLLNGDFNANEDLEWWSTKSLHSILIRLFT